MKIEWQSCWNPRNPWSEKKILLSQYNVQLDWIFKDGELQPTASAMCMKIKKRLLSNYFASDQSWLKTDGGCREENSSRYYKRWQM